MKAWLRTPVAMSRKTLFAITFFLGLLGAIGVVAGAAALRHAAAERDRAIQAETLTRGDVAAIAKRIVEIQSPSRAELIRRVVIALRACAREPRCAGALRQVATSVAPAASTTRRSSPAAGDGSSTRRSARPPTTRPLERPSTRRRDRRDASPPPGSGDGSQQSPGDASPPPATVTAPAAPVQLCTPLVRVNC